MIVRAVKNKRTDLPKSVKEMGFPEGSDEDILDISIGKSYLVYATKEDEDGKWYFVHTDEMNTDSLWWMPASLYEVVDNLKPSGWQVQHEKSATYHSYPLLFDWKVENGIIDGEDWAIEKYLKEVKKDPSFPTQDKVDEFNQEFDQQQKDEKHETDLKLAQERGYEYPEKRGN